MHNEKGVELSMKKYDRLICKMDMDSIALLYTEDGNLGNIAVGRDSIKHLLAKYKDFKVLSQASKTSFLKVSGDSAQQKGTYRQTVILPAKDTITVKGTYTASWQWIKGAGWHIRKMETAQ